MTSICHTNSKTRTNHFARVFWFGNDFFAIHCVYWNSVSCCIDIISSSSILFLEIKIKSFDSINVRIHILHEDCCLQFDCKVIWFVFIYVVIFFFSIINDLVELVLLLLKYMFLFFLSSTFFHLFFLMRNSSRFLQMSNCRRCIVGKKACIKFVFT